jgi:uncharacterized protein YkwD
VLSALGQEMFDTINMDRKVRGLHLLQLDPVLTELAQAHAQDMIDNNYYSHTNLEGATYDDRLKSRGIVLNWVGENFYATNCTEDQASECATRWLMGDESHRNSILNRNYHKVGVGVAISDSGAIMFVQDFTE